MKKLLLTFFQPATVALLIAIGIGLGIEVHPVFFVVILAMTMAALAQTIVNALAHRHR